MNAAPAPPSPSAPPPDPDDHADDAAPPIRPGVVPPGLLFTAREFAAVCGVGKATFYRLLSAGELPDADRRIGPEGGCVRWTRAMVEAGALLEAPAVAALLNVGESTLGDMVRAGKFPRPDSTHGRKRWRLRTVKNWAQGSARPFRRRVRR